MIYHYIPLAESRRKITNCKGKKVDDKVQSISIKTQKVIAVDSTVIKSMN